MFIKELLSMKEAKNPQRECRGLSQGNIGSLLTEKQISAHRDQVRNKRQVMERVINVIKVIGKRGLSYRGDEHERAYSLEDLTLDHGHFLE